LPRVSKKDKGRATKGMNPGNKKKMFLKRNIHREQNAGTTYPVQVLLREKDACRGQERGG